MDYELRKDTKIYVAGHKGFIGSALIRRFYEAKKDDRLSVELWGTGSPRREFVFSDDDVSARILLLKTALNAGKLPVNIGVGHDISIKELV